MRVSVFRDHIRDPAHQVYLSVASVWEAVVKYGTGKLPLPSAPENYLPEQRVRHQIASLSIDESSVHHLATLPPLHRHPFDRILVAQALQHDLTLLTVDDAVRAYAIKLLETS